MYDLLIYGDDTKSISVLKGKLERRFEINDLHKDSATQAVFGELQIVVVVWQTFVNWVE